MKLPTLQEEKKLWKKGYKRVACLDEAGRGCERPDAEILTSNGWKFYADINLKKDKVLSYTDTDYIKWQKIEKVIEKDFEGNLIELKNRGIHIVVTPNHYFTVIRRVSKRDKKDNNRLKLIGYKVRKERKRAIDLSENDFIPRGGKWKGKNETFFKLPKVDKNKEKLIDMKLWVAFLGIFLAEGSASYYKKKGSYRIVISQNENAPQNKYKKIYSLLKRTPFRFIKLRYGFQCDNKQLYTYLKQFGNRYHKFIPKEIKELSPGLLNVLIRWMILGDRACYRGKNRKEVCVYYTVSKGLRDNFEEILLKAGWTYHTSVRALRDGYIKGRIIKKENLVPCFEIRLRRNNKVQIRSLHKRELLHKGKVFCLQLPKYHNFYVRRNGTGYFTGNSLAGPVVAGAALINLKFKIQNLKDSKKLTPKKREELYKIITKNPLVERGIGRVSERMIDKINILEATKLAMIKAIQKLPKKPDFLILDGNFKIDYSHGPIRIPRGQAKRGRGLGYSHAIPQKSIVKADEKVFSCAAASIIAKVARDRIMLKYHKKYPKYCFDLHKGYPTKLHVKLLRKYGPCDIHRLTFRPVKDVLKLKKKTRCLN